jgi:NADH dehydrogenase
VGAGYTGTEVAGVLAEWNRRLVRLGSSARIAVTLAAQDGRLLPEGNKRLAPVAEAVLASKGVVLMLGTPAQQVEVDRVYLRDGGAIEADVVVWAARTRGCQVPTSGPLRLNPEGRIVVDPYLRALGHERVYVAGDLAAAIDYARDRPVPATAQLAIQEAAVVAHNLAAEVRGSTLREFLARPIGEALSLGGSDAVAEVAGVVVSGRLAASVKSTALLRYLVGLGGPRLAARYS